MSRWETRSNGRIEVSLLGSETSPPKNIHAEFQEEENPILGLYSLLSSEIAPWIPASEFDVFSSVSHYTGYSQPSDITRKSAKGNIGEKPEDLTSQ